MGAETKIQWVDHSASPWHGCSEVTVGCDFCYARTMAKRNPGTFGVWGPDGTRVKSASFHANCRRWNEQAKKAGKRATVFPSICDPFEDWQGPILNAKGERFWHLYPPSGTFTTDADGHADRLPVTMDDLRRELFATIDACPNLDFILLTKRPENVRRMWRAVDVQSQAQADNYNERGELYRSNVWLLTSVSNQATADAMIPRLLECRDLVPVLGLSCEPLLGPVDLSFTGGSQSQTPYYLRGNFWEVACENHCTFKGQENDLIPDSDEEGETYVCPVCESDSGLVYRDHDYPGIDWVIVGGESGHGARPYDVAWARSIIAQCRAAGVPVFHKQLGANVNATVIVPHDGNYSSETQRIRLIDPKGGDMSEWPEDLRVREYPKASVTT